MDQVEFDSVVGGVKFDIVFEQLIELLLGFGGKDQRLGGEAVTQAFIEDLLIPSGDFVLDFVPAASAPFRRACSLT